MTGTTQRQHERASSAARRTGYAITIVINAIGLYVVNNILAWDQLPFLTDDFTRVLPLLQFSLVATIAVNVVYLWYDEAVFRSVMQLGLSGISLAVLLRLYDVFPFDFSGYAPVWDTAARALLVLAIVGTVVGVVAETVRLVRSLASGSAAP